jgi:hypothetical protein
MEIDRREWLEVVRGEYLGDFIREGGASVKVVVADGAAGRAAVRDALHEAATASGFQYAFVDAASTKIHLIDRVFHEVARQVDWDALAAVFLARLLSDNGYRLPAQPGDLSLASIADLNELPERGLHVKLESLLWDALFRDYAMVQEFRLAMVRLCRAQLYPDDEPAVTEAVKEWLRGELRRVSALKKALIFQKVARHNARHMLASLAHWLQVAGRSGLVLAIDISRCALVTTRSERDEGFYYSRPAVFDVYEVLRQLIDGTDELAFCFVGVLTGPEFLNDPRRDVTAYPALYYRLSTEVHDRYRQNPLSALVRVGGDG